MSRNARRFHLPDRLPRLASPEGLTPRSDNEPESARLPRPRGAWGNRALVYAAAALLLVGAGAGLGRLVGARTRLEQGQQERRAAERAALWQALEEARRVRDWSRCIEHAGRLLELPPAPGDSHDRVQEALEQAIEEQQNLLVYDRFLQAVARRAPDAAVLAYLELSANSVYRELGAVRYQEARSAFVRLHTEQARQEMDRLGCQAAQPHLDAVAAVDPEAAESPELAAVRRRCQPPPAPPRSPSQPPGQKTLLASRGPLEQQAAERPPPPRDLEDAQQAYITGDYREAIRIARQHTRRDPARAWRVIGGAACYLGDEGLIRQTLDHLDDPAQRFVRQVCQRNGIVP